MPAQAGGRKRTRTDLERGGAPIEADAATASTEQEEHEAELEALEAELAAVRADTKKLRCLICLHRSACTDALAQSSSTTLQKAMRGVDILVSIVIVMNLRACAPGRQRPLLLPARLAAARGQVSGITFRMGVKTNFAWG